MATVVSRNLKEISEEVTKLNQEIKKANTSNKELDKSLRFDPTNANLLSAKTENLNKAMTSAKQKVDHLKDAKTKLNIEFQKGNVSEQEFKRMSIEVGKAEVEVKKLNVELEKTNSKSFEKIKNNLNSVSRGATIAVGALVALEVGYANMGDTISKATERYKISAEEFQKGKFIFDRATGNENAYVTALDEVQAKMAQVEKGSSKTIASFEKMGISAEELKGKSASEALELIISKLKEVEDYDERVTLANMILSSSGTEMAQVAGLTAEQIEELNQKLEKQGILTQEEADNAAELKDSMDDLKLSFMKVIAELGQSLIPLMEVLIQIAGFLAPVISFLASVFQKLGTPIQTVVGVVLILLIILPKLMTVLKAVDVVLKLLSANPITLKIMLICMAVVLLITLIVKLANVLGSVFGKKYTLDVDTNALNLNSQAIQLQATNQELGASNVTNNYYDYSTMENNISKEVDADEVVDKIKTEIRIRK